MPIYDYVCTACDHRADILHGDQRPGPHSSARRAARGDDAQAVLGADDPLQGVGLGEEGPRRRRAPVAQRVERASGSTRRAPARDVRRPGRPRVQDGGRSGSDSGRRRDGSSTGRRLRARATREARRRRTPATSATARRRRLVRLGRLTPMPSAADWITLAEAAEILAAANVHFRPRRSAAGRGPGACRASSSAVAGTCAAARSGR